MCGFVGMYNKKENIRSKDSLIRKMNDTLINRGLDQEGYYFDDSMLLGFKRLAIMDLEKGIQPMSYENYVIVYNGEIYNTDSLRNDLIDRGYTFDTTSDTEVVLKGYVCYKEKILDLLEGMYAFSIYDGKKVFLARDRVGVKPLFYTLIDNTLIFASEIKAILEHPKVERIIDLEGLHELLALGPSRIPGSGVFKNIYELEPAHYMYFDIGIKIKRYWNVKNEKFTDTFSECTNKIRDLLSSAIKRQIRSDVGVSCLLSGGVDSSIITGVVAEELSMDKKRLNTYSLDYKDNHKYFKKNDYQVALDKYYIEKVSKKFKTKHKHKILSQSELADLLKEAVLARDLPGMADIDSSLYWFSKKVREYDKVVLSGEGADEIFGGYPWFYKEKELDNFPWIHNLSDRYDLLNDDLKKKMDLEKFSKKYYNETLKEVPKCKDKKEQHYKNLIYLNMIWFMPSLLERKDRMTMRANLEARVPFSDHHLIEYLWNVPWEYKFYNMEEKGLLREAFKDLLPTEVLHRKKNPYPKTHNPKYAEVVVNMLKERLENKDSILYKIFDIKKLEELISTKGDSFKNPWFGQLMTGPQLIAYLYQFDIWSKIYKVKFQL